MGVYRCKQGCIGITIVTPAQWNAFCELMGMPELGRDPHHVMGGERLARADALEARFIPRFLDRTAEEWFALGLELRLPFAIVPDMQQVLSWPVFRDRKAIVPIEVGGRTVEAPGTPFHLTADAAELRRQGAGTRRAQRRRILHRAGQRRRCECVAPGRRAAARRPAHHRPVDGLGRADLHRATSPISAPT